MEINNRRLTARSEYADYGNQKVLKIHLNDLISKEMCLIMMLLYRGLIDFVNIQLEGFYISLTLGTEKQSRCLDLQVKEKRVELSVAPNAVGLILNFLLKYYRDGISEAEHIDIDFKYSDEAEFTLTLTMEKFKMLSQKEMENLLKD